MSQPQPGDGVEDNDAYANEDAGLAAHASEDSSKTSSLS